MRFEIYKDRKGEFRWRLVARNNRKIATSGEGYTRKSDCHDAINKIKDRAGVAPVGESKT